MKKFYLLMALLLGTFSMRATHLMGGEITVQSLGNSEYLVAMVVYRDTAGIPMQQNAIFELSDSSGNVISTFTVSYDSLISGNQLPQYPYGVELYLFVDTITITTPGHYSIGWDNCCRNGAIQNLSTPLSESMYIKTDFTVFPTSSNSTPFFLVPAAIFLPVNTPWQYNPLPFDPDGDSLYWSVDAPLGSATNYCAGFTTPPGDTLDLFSLNPVTGTISWTANTEGNFVATVLVEEFRNGQRNGGIRRDMQFIVTNPAPIPIYTNTAPWPINIYNEYSFPVVAGQTFQMSILADHTDPLAQLDMELYGELVNNPNYAPQFSFNATGNGSEIEGQMVWNVPLQLNVGQRFLNVVRVSDGLYTMDESFWIEVVSAVGLSELKTEGPLLYPNPVKDALHLHFNTHHQDVQWQIKVYSLSGQCVKTEKTERLSAGTTEWVLPVELQSGQYFLQITSTLGSYTQAFVVQP